MLKQGLIFIAIFLFLFTAPLALAEDGVNAEVEVIRMDGVSVVVLTPASTMERARGLLEGAPNEAFSFPEQLTIIEEEAFAGIAAERVDISANVVRIEARAFADCPALREIHIPATVLEIDSQALAGCENVIVYGESGSAAERFADAAGFAFADTGTEPAPTHPTRTPGGPVKLPPVRR